MRRTLGWQVWDTKVESLWRSESPSLFDLKQMPRSGCPRSDVLVWSRDGVGGHNHSTPDGPFRYPKLTNSRKTRCGQARGIFLLREIALKGGRQLDPGYRADAEPFAPELFKQARRFSPELRIILERIEDNAGVNNPQGLLHLGRSQLFHLIVGRTSGILPNPCGISQYRKWTIAVRFNCGDTTLQSGHLLPLQPLPNFQSHGFTYFRWDGY